MLWYKMIWFRSLLMTHSNNQDIKGELFKMVCHIKGWTVIKWWNLIIKILTRRPFEVYINPLSILRQLALWATGIHPCGPLSDGGSCPLNPIDRYWLGGVQDDMEGASRAAALDEAFSSINIWRGLVAMYNLIRYYNIKFGPKGIYKTTILQYIIY